ncbi:DNA/RNA non-specific endonuclease [Methylobacterium sp. SyP6R]|uniref:DNA/RNA non-specific endonuclease n=1 Tax=Methylobacterium sp. SyP6R TaxID=2718876 RepID=UPI001F00C4C4|nr:DNA/RNA non-specific endonuclease [Methylobacterium sp. SyP6R]MCF4125353.1 DNA/RNA non-specific endonuclease [Methylobacterium sp. SyP6R]
MTSIAPLRSRVSPAGRALLLLLVVSAAPALARNCPEHFAGGTPPVLTNPRLSADTTLLCYQAFAVLYSGLSRTPLYAAEHLTAARVEAARRIDRVDAFHEEDRLPEAVRSDLADYAGSGWDRGHMAPSGDMPSPSTQAESFTLANIVPQDPDLNRRLWAGIESSVRALAIERGDLFVVTGPLFEGTSVQSLRGRVLIPTRLFKAVYDANRGEAGVYLARNAAPGETWEAISLDQLAGLGGIVAFPDLPDSVRRRIMKLPEPRRDEYAGGPRSRREPSILDWLAAELRRAARRAWRDFLRSLF